MVETFSIKCFTYIANQFFANAGRFEGTDLSPQALVDHALPEVSRRTPASFLPNLRATAKEVFTQSLSKSTKAILAMEGLHIYRKLLLRQQYRRYRKQSVHEEWCPDLCRLQLKRLASVEKAFNAADHSLHNRQILEFGKYHNVRGRTVRVYR